VQDRGGGRPGLVVVDLGVGQSGMKPWRISGLRCRKDTIRFVVAGEILAGLECGRLDRSCMPSLPSAR
jgi:hypothetical protein